MTSPREDDLGSFKAGASEQSPFLIVVLDNDMRIRWVNATVSRLCDVPAERWAGRELGHLLSGLETGDVDLMLRGVLETGQRITDAEHRGPLLHGSPPERTWSVSGFRIEGPGGAVIGVTLVASDVTRRSQDRERLGLLNEASERIGSTLDIFRTADETLDVLVPRVGDLGLINLLSYVLEGGPQPRFELGAHPVRMELAATRWTPSGLPPPARVSAGDATYLEPSSLYYQWLSEGRTIFAPRLSDTSADFDRMSESEFFRTRLDLLKAAGAHTGVIVPISARGVILGTAGVWRTQRPAFTDVDVSLVQDVLARSAICLDNARVYTRERATALELQRSMLPQSIAPIAGIELAYRYEPANVAAEIGGDWFDVVHQSDGCVALIVGDVTGHDIHAASLMGQLRTVTRTLATLNLTPVEVLTRLDAVVSDMGFEVGATCVYAAVNPDTGHCVIARAGHPPPALVHPDGAVGFLELPAGLPLGVGGVAFDSRELDLEPGCVLVLYTDGLIESRAAGIDTGMSRLARALADRGEEAFGHRYASDLINRLVPDPADDIALLLARFS